MITSIAIKAPWVEEGEPQTSGGWGNGYVAVSKEHTFWGVSYQTANEFVEVHGGLTYDNEVTEKNYESFGLSESEIGWWLFGFDSNHLDDNIFNFPEARVVFETTRLKERFEELASYKRQHDIEPSISVAGDNNVVNYLSQLNRNEIALRLMCADVANEGINYAKKPVEYFIVADQFIAESKKGEVRNG